jgi:pyruvate/2-oxoglutarate dehydrogenase complex dihydrolipoamide dehydrogenase (E3) component
VVSSTLPTLATVGITEERAKVQFGDRVSTLQQSLTALPKIQGTVEELGYIKLILLDNQQILGAHLLGAGAEELISLFALAIQQKMGWNAIAKLTFPSGTFAEGVQKLMNTYQQDQLKKSRFRQQWLESLWLWRR